MTPGPPMIDLVARKLEDKIAIEIESGKNSKEQILENITKCLSAGYKIIYSVGTNDKAYQKIKEAIPVHYLEINPGIKILRAKEILKFKG